MTPAESEYLLTQLSETRERMLGTLHGLSHEQLVYCPEAGRWSVADNVEHLLVAEKRVVGGIEKLLQLPPDDSKRPAMSDRDIILQVGTVVERVQALPQSMPASLWPPEELVQEFEKTRQRTFDFAATVDGDLRRRFMPHFLFGDLDCYQWLVLLAMHCQRHCAQSESVKASPGFQR
jgi:DinB superfamily